MNSVRPPSIDRPSFVPYAKVLSGQTKPSIKGIARRYKLRQGKRDTEIGNGAESGDPACLLSEAAFDTLGAVRFLRSGNISFARAAIRSALDELTAAAQTLGVR